MSLQPASLRGLHGTDDGSKGVRVTLGRVEEILDEVEADARRDYRPETLRYVIEALDEVRRRLGLDLSEDE